MGPEIIERLLDINRGFYQSFAEPFMATRGRLQPGVTLSLESLPLNATVLDLGCAHGVLAEELKGRGFSGCYVGLDSSLPLLESISDDLRPPYYQFGLADLSSTDWPATAHTLLSESECEGYFDRAFAFAVLHHLPGTDLRKSALGAIRDLLGTEGRITLSVWDFLESPRLRERIVPWETMNIHEYEVDDRDYLIDWREGGLGVRYVHHFSTEELRALADATSYRVVNEYRSDGENGRLGLYQIWEVN